MLSLKVFLFIIIGYKEVTLVGATPANFKDNSVNGQTMHLSADREAKYLPDISDGKPNNDSINSKLSNTKPIEEVYNANVTDDNTIDHCAMCACGITMKYSSLCNSMCCNNNDETLIENEEPSEKQEAGKEKNVNSTLLFLSPQPNKEIVHKNVINISNITDNTCGLCVCYNKQYLLPQCSMCCNPKDVMAIDGGEQTKYLLGYVILMLIVIGLLLLTFVIYRKAKQLCQRQHYKRANYLIDGMYSERNPLCFSEVIQLSD